jgi:hypothetical protein
MPIKRARSAECAADEAYRIATARRREPAARAEHAQHPGENSERQVRATEALIREADEQTQDRQHMASNPNS